MRPQHTLEHFFAKTRTKNENTYESNDSDIEIIKVVKSPGAVARKNIQRKIKTKTKRKNKQSPSSTNSDDKENPVIKEDPLVRDEDVPQSTNANVSVSEISLRILDSQGTNNDVSVSTKY